MNEIESVIAQLEKQQAAIERALGALREVAGTAPVGAQRRGRLPAKKRGRKGQMSAEGRARIGQATRERWAAKRAAEAAPAKKTRKPAKKAKRVMSPEGRARIAAAAKRMWAVKKAAE